MEKINTVQLSVQSAEAVMVGHDKKPQLVVNGTLMNLARGHIVLNVQTFEFAHVGGIGELEIDDTRPVMQAHLHVSYRQFSSLLKLLRSDPPRPPSAVIALKEELSTSPEGYLVLDGRRRCVIADISWSIPIL
ncbi:hypothetical protein [Lacimonas salitolerans]|uniref:Uncharacterized protein n=1 Tax=Lacimonas salitolerans TaxID=1323750 RepID=A0ABW4EIF0_9RHOB